MHSKVLGSEKVVSVTKIFTFEMAHALLGYDGLCKNIHGHSYKLHVTISGKPLQQHGHPKDGMVVDFKELKSIVREMVIYKFDHALVLNRHTPNDVISALKKSYEKIFEVPYQPTCENLLLEMVSTLQAGLPNNLELSQLRLYETATSYAEWKL